MQLVGANLRRYEQNVLALLRELEAELESALGAAGIFRGYRDIRFPALHKPNVAAVVGRLYLHFDARV